MLRNKNVEKAYVDSVDEVSTLPRLIPKQPIHTNGFILVNIKHLTFDRVVLDLLFNAYSVSWFGLCVRVG